MADHGLGTEARWRKDDLAHWTAKLAQQQGDGALALRAAQVAFGSGNALADFKLARELAGAEWPAVKRELLAGMEASHHFNKAEIYLAEGMLVEAMAVIDRESYSSGLEQVIQATRAEYPEWGIGKCRPRAEAIMDAGKSNDYANAVAWLRSARDIYRQHGRQAEWSAYLSGLLEKHGRKYKLVPMLREIG